MAPGMGRTNTVQYAEKKDELQVTVTAPTRMASRRTVSGWARPMAKPMR
jgi:hypothetical protein